MKSFKKLCIFVILSFCCIFFMGCWDSVELDKIFIITALAIDTTENPDEFEVTIEVAKTGNLLTGNAINEKGTSQNTIVVKERGTSMLEVFEKFDYDSSRRLMFQHCQVVLMSKEIAEQGITRYMDFFLRGRQPRIEVIIAIVDGNAGEVLELDPQQEATSSKYVLGIIEDREEVSGKYKIRILDFVNDMLSKPKASVIPMIAIVQSGEHEKIELRGLAFLKNGKLIDSQSENEALGFLLAENKVNNQIIGVQTENGIINYYIQKMRLDKKIEIKNDKLFVSYKIYPVLRVTEIVGFKDFHFLDFIDHATDLVEQEIEKKLLDSIDFFKEINTDVLQFSVNIYKRNPNLWKKIEDRWDDIFKNLEIDVKVRANIPSTGKSAESISMEQEIDENR